MDGLGGTPVGLAVAVVDVVRDCVVARLAAGREGESIAFHFLHKKTLQFSRRRTGRGVVGRQKGNAERVRGAGIDRRTAAALHQSEGAAALEL